MENHSTQQTIAIVKASAELHHAQQIARSLTISSKNLRTFAMRIGQTAAGLAILASFYEEFSRNAITLANKVSSLTLTSAKDSVEDWRTELFEGQLDKACLTIEPDSVPLTVQQHLGKRQLRIDTNRANLLAFDRDIRDSLLEMKKNIRSIAVIAVNSKIEAPKTGEHYGALLDMANNVEDMISLIMTHIDTATAYLNQRNLKSA